MNVQAAIVGELGIFTAREVQEQLLCACAAAGEGDVIEIDLSAVSEIDSAGLQLMLAAKRQAAAAGRALRFAGHSPAVLEVIDLCDLAGQLGDPLLLARD